jgi:hypothetical protein
LADYLAQQCERLVADLFLGSRIVADEDTASDLHSSAEPIAGQV